MARANSNFRVANIFIFALLITLCASICLLGVFSIPHNEHKAEATLQNPAVDFLPAPEFFGFEPAPGKTGTYYALGLRSSVSEEFSELFNYRVHSIPFVENGNTINKNYGVYQAYYSANAVQHIVKSFEFRKYYFVSVKSDEENPPEPYYADVTTTDFDVIYSDDPPFNNPSRPDPNSPDDYEPEDVKISSSQVEGVRWDGSTYNGALKGIDAAGTYRIKQLSVTYGGQTYSAPNDMHLIIVLKARLTVGSSAFAPLFTSDNRIQFGLNTQARTYGENSNFRDVIGVSNATKEDGKFYFSAGNDKYFFLTSFGKNRNGVSVDSPTVLTNLDYVKDYLKVKWYDYQIVASRPIRESIDDGQPIDSAGQYSISLDWTVEFDYYADYIHTYMQGGIEKTAELTTVVEVVYGTSNDYQDFYKEFTVEKRSLNFSEDRSETGGFNGGIAVTREIEFSGNPLSASGLFSNSKISTKEMWLALNGVESDYDNTAVYDGYTFADYINNFSIVSFVGSHFNDASIGENKIVFLYMELLASNSQGVDELLKNYKAQFGYYINGTYTPFNPKSPTEQEFYQLATIENELGEIIFDGNFKILPNKITLNFSKETNYVYAQKGSQNDFNFAVDPIVSTFGKIVTNNWEVKIVTGSAGSAAVRDPVQNRIYIGIMVGRRNNDTADPVYIDGNGNKYTSYDSRARLYAGEYYFYYTVYVIHASTSSSYEGSVLPATDRAGFFDVKDRSGTVICELDLSQLQQLLITPFRFTVRVESMINEKDYDGTTDLLSFEAVLLDSQGNVSSIGSVYAPDELMVTTSLSASYSHPMAGENNPIVREFKLIKKEETATAENILRSYEIVPGEISGEWYENGIIHRLPLTINVVDYAETVRIDGKDYPLYRRNYNEVDYVIIQIAKAGDTLPDGFVAMEDYYYFYNPDDSNNGIVTASQLALERNLGVAAEKCIIITMDGFLEDEGILWDHSGVVNPINPPNIKNIFSWFDSVKGKRIEQNTDSSADDNDYYRIEFNDEEALNTLFYNYSIVLHQQCPQYSYLHIGKLELEPNFLFVQKSERYTYSGLSQKEYTVTCEGDAKAIFNFSGHHEADAIIAKLLSDGKTFADLVEVLEFSRDCDQTCPHGHYNVQDELIRNMVLAGTYSLEFTLPASTNYKGGTVYGTLRIEPKEVQAIITFAIRSYLELNPVYHTDYDEILYVNTDNELDIYSYWIKIGEEGISYEVIAYPKLIGDKISYYLVGSNEEITPIELQNIYNATKVYIDFRPITMNGQSDFDYHKEQSEDVHGLKTIYYKDGDDYIATDAYVNGVSSYYMFNEYTMNNTVIYRGFLVDGGQESFLPTELPHQVYFSVNQGNDRAYTNGLDGGVKAMDAFKHNFEFVTAEQKFYILKKALSIDVGENYNQTGVYSGNELTPMYTLVGGPANAGGVRVNIHAYTYDGQTQTYEYIIDGLPIEQIPFGFGLDMKLMDAGIYTLRLYASPSAEFMINYAAKREATVITFEVLPLEIVFIGQDESIPYSNSEYQIGGFDDYFSGQNSNWGSVEIVQILKGQEVVDKIIASGVYHVTILGILYEDFRKNLYFDDGYGGYVYVKDFSYNVTITASASYQFKLTNDLGGVDLEDGSGFQFTYNGKSYSPTYMFINLEEDTDLLPVSWTVTNSFNNDDPIKNADTYVLTFEINATSHPEHNSNYASYEGENAQVFYVIINKAVLNVTLGFEEGYSPKKTYLDDNSVIEDHIYFIYTGWVDGEDGSEPINKITNEPIIDWEFNDGDKTIVIDKYTPAGLYGIRAKAGEDTTVLQNYYFSYSGS
ncbi:MAG: hypothetical protein GX242_01395, partial [Clostridiales bacterium]|nr:hypothetical protein [Clostridiales bacterium]